MPDKNSGQTVPSPAGTDPDPPVALSSAVYAKLRELAQQQMRGERSSITLQPTALVHEAYLRLLRDPSVNWSDDREFYWAAAESMRRVLIDEARRRTALKRGGGRRREGFDEPAADAPASDQSEPTELLDRALDDLQSMDARLYEVVMLRYFAGLSVEITATTLGVAPRTVKRDWATARSWLRLTLAGTSLPGEPS